jgi:hypothetical protein
MKLLLGHFWVPISALGSLRETLSHDYLKVNFGTQS